MNTPSACRRPSPRCLAQILGLALLYAATIRLGIFIAQSSEHAPIFWPASGLALAAVIVGGWPMALGVLAGALAGSLNVSTPSGAAPLVMSAVFATAAALQAWLGALVLRRFVGSLPPQNIGLALRALALTALIALLAPLASVVAASLVGTTAWSQAWALLWPWWVAVYVGMLVVTPTVIVAVKHWRKQHGTSPLVWLLASLMVALALVSYMLTWNSEKSQFNALLATDASEMVNLIDSAMQENEHTLLAVNAFFSASQEVERDEFALFTTRLLKNSPSIETLAWAPRVPAAERETFEQHFRQLTGVADFFIYENEANGQRVPAAERAEYFPATFFEPFDANRAALGFDISTESNRWQAVTRARDSGQSQLTSQIGLVYAVDQLRLLLMLPAYHGGASLDTIEQRREALSGVTYLIFDVNELLDRALKTLNPHDIALYILDVTDAEPQLLAFYPSRSGSQTLPADMNLDLTSLGTAPYYSENLSLYGRTWSVIAEPGPAYLAERRSWDAWFRLALGLASAVVFIGYMSARQQSEAKLRKLNRAYMVLSEVNETIVRVRDQQTLFNQACQIAVERGGFRMAWIGVLDPVTEQVLPVAHAGEVDGYLTKLNITLDDSERGRGPAATALRAGQHIVVNDISSDVRMLPWRTDALQLGYHSVAVFPLIIDGTVNGVLSLYAPEPGFFDQAELKLFDEMAIDLAFALEFMAQEQQRRQAEQALTEERNLLARRVEERTADLSRANVQLARAVRAKDEFLANMSHELRTPLNAILALSEGLLEQVRGPLNQRQQTSIHNIEASGRHLLALINDILDLSKVEAGRMDLLIEAVSIADICEASLIFVKETANKKKLRLTCELNNPSARVEADPRRLKQMLVNLLSNAVKFTEPGGEVNLRVNADAEAGVVRFAVQDTGIGMTADGINQLFQPFAQLDSSLSRQHEGTGLGLALVRRLAELHGGSVTVDSEPGKGSCFTIALPYSAQRAENTALSVAPSASASLSADTPRSALVVEDSESAADQLARYLQEINIHAVIHSRGEDALEQAIALQPDVIFLDLLLPDQTGWSVLAQLKANAATRDIPVIIASVVDERMKGLATGAADYLVKPISRETLHKTLGLVPIQGEIARAAMIIAPAIEPAHKDVSILLAEDNEINILAIGDYLHDKGHHLLIARNGQEALSLAEEARPDLILTDIQMPVMDGLELIRRLRAHPDFAAVPIIALTALAMPGDRERCLAAGANEYMTKPVSLKELTETIQRLIEP